jgi:hypothetical protein
MKAGLGLAEEGLLAWVLLTMARCVFASMYVSSSCTATLSSLVGMMVT